MSIFILSGESFAESPYREGRIAYSRRNFDAAMKHFQAAIKADPGDGNPYFFIGSIQEYQNNREAATESYRRGVDLRMDSDLRERALWKIMLYYRYTGNWDGVAAYAQRFLAVRESSDVRRLLNEAESRRDPKTAEIQRLLNRGVEDFDKKDYESAERRFSQVLDLSPDNEAALWKMSLTLMEMNRYRSAESYLKKLIKPGRETWEYHYKHAVCLYHLRRYEDSLQAIQNARRLNADKGPKFRRFTEILESLNLTELDRFSEAEKILAPLKERSPLQNGILARSRLANGQDEDALRIAVEALKKDPQQKDALLVRMMLSLRNRNPEGTLENARPLNHQLLSDYSSEKLPSAAIVKGLSQAADFLYQSGEYFTAADIYKNISIFSDLTESQKMNYANALLLTDRPERASAEAGKIRSAKDRNYMLARIAAASGDMQKARSFIEAAAREDSAVLKTVRSDTQLSGWMTSDPSYNDFINFLENSSGLRK